MKEGLIAIGESLVDCLPEGNTAQGLPLFSANPGGAPANLLALFAKLGGRCSLISKVGSDELGRLILRSLEKTGVNTSYLKTDEIRPTSMAMVSLDERGERSFRFYRAGGADLALNEEDLPKDALEHCKFFYFGSLCFTDSPLRETSLTALKLAKQAGAWICYDPNYRPLLWKEEGEALCWMKKGLEFADILKVSKEELCLLTGEEEMEAGARKLLSAGPALLFVTLGEEGVYYLTHRERGYLPSLSVKAIDTTGAGDGFFGAVLWKLNELEDCTLSSLTKQQLEEISRFGVVAGALVTTKKGAIPAMPTLSEIQQGEEAYQDATCL